MEYLKKISEWLRKALRGLVIGLGTAVLCLIIYTVVIFNISKPMRPTVPSQSIIAVTMDGARSESYEAVDIFSLEEPRLTHYETVKALSIAATDPRIQAVVLKVKPGRYELAQIQELHSVFRQIRQNNKPIYVYAYSFGDLSPGSAVYTLASAASEIWLHPIGLLNLSGLAVAQPFIADALERVGIKPEFFQQGRYKTGAEFLTRSEISNSNKEMTQRLLNSLGYQLTDQIVQNRNLDLSDIKTVIRESPLTQDEALVADLVDSIGHPDQFSDYIKQRYRKAKPISLAHYAAAKRSLILASDNNSTIHLVTVSGPIVMERGRSIMGSVDTGAEDIAANIISASKRKGVKAVVVRINSPGGTPLAAEVIRRAIVKARKTVPVVVSFGRVAASGGYWAATDADLILADKATLTGSIGVFGGKFDISGLMDKLGINWHTTTYGQNSDISSQIKPLSKEQSEIVQNLMAQSYDQFLSRVSEGRKIPIERVQDIAQGQVWTGYDGTFNGLVDATGGLLDAIAAAKEIAGVDLEDVRGPTIFPRPLSPVERVMKFATSHVSMSMFKQFTGYISSTLFQGGDPQVLAYQPDLF